MKRLIIGINRVLAESSGYLLLVVMFLTVADVVLRNLGIAFFGIVEVSVFVMVAAVFFGLGHCEEEDGHVRITVLLNRLSPASRQILRTCMAVLSLAIMCLATYACALSALSAYNSNDAVMASDVAIYSWPARTAIVIGLFFYCCQLGISIGIEFSKLREALVEKRGQHS